MVFYLSEYHEAKDRFQRNNKKESTKHEEIEYLDDLIQKLYFKYFTIDIGSDSTLFYNLIFHSDFLQLKEDVIKIFYSELCFYFLTKNIIEDIIENLECLECIPHLENYLVSGLLQSCQLEPFFINDSLSLRHSTQKLWHSLNIINFDDIIIQNNIITENEFSNSSFVIRCLKLLLRLGAFKGLTLSGCQLNEENVTILSKKLQIQSLTLSRCGSYVNFIIQKNFCGVLDMLTTLDISNNDIVNATLEKIRWIPLKSLNISNCTPISDPTVTTAQPKNTSECKDKEIPNIDILWEEGILRETIEILDVSLNNLSQINLKKISQIQLRQLDISSCLNANSLHISSVVFPNTLKILKSRHNRFTRDDLEIMDETSLEEIEIQTSGKEKSRSCSFFFTLLRKIKKVSVFEGNEERAFLSLCRSD